VDKRCRDIIALNLISDLGPRKMASLLRQVSDTEEIFHLSGSEFNKITADPIRDIGRLKTIRASEDLERELKFIEDEGISPICIGDEDYPEDLVNIYDPPSVIFCKGRPCSQDRNAVAIVGSRNCSAYGIRMAEKIAYDLAEKGITIVSGMARGVDSAAHRGALKAGGRTIAVMGSGFRYIFPQGSKDIVSSISKSGAVLTEYISEIHPSKSTFPRRNRIISGMAKGIVVVEAAMKSGALITADFALQQGRDVFAVPGPADSYASKGTNKLIQDGAKLVMCAEDVIEELNLELCSDAEKQSEFAFEGMGEVEYRVIEILKDRRPIHVDHIFESVEIDPGVLRETLLRMEIKGLLKKLAGQNYMLNYSEEKIYAI